MSERLGNLQMLRENCCSTEVEVSSMSERDLRTLKSELKNLRQVIGDSLPQSGLEDITPLLLLIASFKCDPVYKYPSFDFIGMYLYCYVVSGSFSG